MKYIISFVIVFVLTRSMAQEYTQKPPELTRILFLLDGSGSMLAPFESGTRIQAAKRVLSDLVDSLKTIGNLELALRVYGHQFPRSQQNCRDTRLEVGFSPGNHELIKTRLRMIRPKGTTPLAFSLEQAAKDFPAKKDVRNILIIITDGLESCDGDPCAISLEIQRKGILLKPFVIGLGLDLAVKERFDCLGKYLNTNKLSEFKKSLTQITKQSLGTTTVSVELLDANRNKTETNVNVTFLNNFTKLPYYDFIHFRDKNGAPDTILVDPVNSYDVMVSTIPPVQKRNVDIVPGTHNIIEIQSPQGKLIVNQENSTEYQTPVKILVRQSGKDKIIHILEVNKTQDYLVGSYDLEILTLPRRYYQNIRIVNKQTFNLEIVPPGILNIKLSSEGIISIYEIDQLGMQHWIKNLESDKKAFTFAMQPGTYKVVYRAGEAQGSKFTEIENIVMKSGSTVNLSF